jgi:hypothetical protein
MLDCKNQGCKIFRPVQQSMWAAKAAQRAARNFSGLLFFGGSRMKKSELLRALQTEIQKHHLSTFTGAQDKVVITGCSFYFGTVEQFKRHITDYVLPPVIDRLSSNKSE